MSMSQKRRRRLLVRVPFVTAVLTALFWGAWYWMMGSVPVINMAVMKMSTSISRWTDILVIPAFAFLFTFLFTSRKVREGENDDLVIVLALVGSFFGLAFEPIAGLVIVLAVLAISLIIVQVLSMLDIGIDCISKLVKLVWDWTMASE